MIQNAIEALLSVYGRDKEIEDIRQKREVVAERLKIFTKKVYNKKLAQVESFKNEEDLSEAEKLFKIKIFEDFEIYKIQFEAYTAMNDDIMNYDKLLKKMNLDIKKAKNKYKDIRRMSDMFENLKIEWS